MLPIGRLRERTAAGTQHLAIDVTFLEGDLLEAGNLNPLAPLHDAYELRGIQKIVVGAGIEPREAA